MENEKRPFEERLKRVEEIVQAMENQSLPLEDVYKLFEEGNALVKELTGELNEAKEERTNFSTVWMEAKEKMKALSEKQ